MAGSSEPLPGKCGAKLRLKPGRFCTQNPAKGKTRCKLHGGKSLSGIAHPNYRHGKFSVVLAGMNLGKHYEDARTNPALVNLTEHIALIDGRLLELFELLASGDAPRYRERVREIAHEVAGALEAFRRVVNTPSPDRARLMAQALTVLGTVVGTLVQIADAGCAQNEAWVELTQQIYLHKKLVDSEVRRQKAASDVLLKAEALTLMRSIADSIHRHVSDARVKQAVMDDIRQIMTSEQGPQS